MPAPSRMHALARASLPEHARRQRSDRRGRGRARARMAPRNAMSRWRPISRATAGCMRLEGSASLGAQLRAPRHRRLQGRVGARCAHRVPRHAEAPLARCRRRASSPPRSPRLPAASGFAGIGVVAGRGLPRGAAAGGADGLAGRAPAGAGAGRAGLGPGLPRASTASRSCSARPRSSARRASRPRSLVPPRLRYSEGG